MKNKQYMFEDDVKELINNLLDQRKYKQALLIGVIFYVGYNAKELKDLTKAEILKVLDQELIERCSSFLKNYNDTDTIYHHTTQHINLELRNVQRFYEDKYVDYENFNTHFFRKSYANKHYRYFLATGLTHYEALQKVGFMLNQYFVKDTINYLHLETTEEQLKKEHEEHKNFKGFKVLKRIIKEG